MPEIKAENVSYSYRDTPILDGVSFALSGAMFVSVLGANGSGKSTLMKLLDALLPLSDGDIFIDGLSIKDEKNIPEIRKRIGFVFQDPDSQFVSPVLEEDIAFGPENHGFGDDEIERRVSESLSAVSLSSYRKRIPQLLSGGEKERAALAGILAIDPDIVILDEPFSMLDENGRAEMLRLTRKAFSDKLILYVTHRAEEAADSDRVIVLDSGKIIAEGEPADVLYSDAVENTSIRLPLSVRIAKKLGLDKRPLSDDELLEALCI